MKRNLLKSLLSLTLVVLFVFSTASGIFPINSVVKAANVYCNVKFSKPAICCDVGETIDLTKCGVQFTADTPTVTSGISWTNNGSAVTTFKPTSAGTYNLVAKSGSYTKTIYVVAKNPTDTEYVLYFNDFDSSTGLRLIEKSSGAHYGTSGGVLYMDASQNAENVIRILFPSFLEEFGDMKISSSVRLTSVVDSSRWGSIIYRVQNTNYPYMQGRVQSNIGGGEGLQIIERTPDNGWYFTTNGSVDNVDTYYYFDLSVSVKDTTSTMAINGTDIIKFNKTPYETGGVGYEIRGLRFTSQYVKITIDGNETEDKTQRVSFAKPAIRAEMGDIIDLTKCDVQLTADSLYTKGSNITWKQNGNVITKFVPSAPGLTTLTATANGITKTVYILTKSLQVGEYVLYYNDFSIPPTDYRIVEKSGSTNVYHDGAAGTYVIDASKSSTNCGRVLLPMFLDEFGDIKIEARIMETNAVNDNSYSSIMVRMQNGNYPYAQFSSKYNAASSGGVNISNVSSSSSTDVLSSSTWSYKSKGGYNIISALAQGNYSAGYINGAQVISSENTPYSVGSMGIVAKGLTVTIDYVKVTLGDTSAEEDTEVKCGIAASMPAIGCNAGQKVVLSECDVQLVYGTPTIKGSDITWTYNGKTITEFEAPLGISVLEAKSNDRVLKVWVVGKKSSESEYVLYYNDFASSASANDIRVIETTNNGRAYYENGTYVLNASNSADTYVRILLPENLSIFGDGDFVARVKLTNPIDESKWASMMYRVQNGDFPYAQGCLRYNASLSNGTELASKTASGAWNVTQTGSYSGLVKDGFNTWMINSSAKTSKYYINGSNILTEVSTPYSVGDWGLQARGLTLTVDYVKLSFKTNHTKATIYTLPGNYADTRDPETGIRLAPALVTEVKTMKDFNNLLNDSPAIAIVTYNSTKGIVLSDGVVSLDKAVDKMRGTIIPAFRVNDNNSVDALAAYLEENDLRDIFVVSSNPAIVKRATDAWKHIRGVMDYSGASLSAKAETLRAEGVANGARVVILKDEYCTKEKVTYIHDMFSCVWIVAGEGKTASVSAINKGPYGIVTPDRTVTEACYRDYYATNTMIRRPNSIGHRCSPELSHENSLSGLKLALSNGATMVEHDIYIAADGVLMVMHDSTIDRTTNGSGKIESMTSTELKKYVLDQYSKYPTEPIPTLEDFFKYCKEDPSRKLVVEVKTAKSEYASALYNLIQKYQLQEQVVVITFGSTPIYDIRDLIPGMPVSNLTSAVPLDDNDPIVTASNLISRAQGFNSVLSVEYPGLGANTIRECAYRGLTLWPWTVDSRSLFDELWLGNAGGITTNCCYYASDYIANLSVNSNGRVIATNYKGTQTDVTNSVEMVVVEDTLGIKFSGGVVTVPNTSKGGKASYFFRYRSTTGSGQQYYTVTDVQTVEVVGDGTADLTLKTNSNLVLSDGLVRKVAVGDTVASVSAQFDSEVTIVDANGKVISGNALVTTGCVVRLANDNTKSAVIIIWGDVNKDGKISATDYLQIKKSFMNEIDLDDISSIAADCSEDGKISSTDYVQLKSYFIA